MPPTCNGTITTCDSPTPNSPCEDCSTECKEIVSTNCIIYNGVALTNIDIVTGDELNEVLEALDECCGANTLTFAVGSTGLDFAVTNVAGVVTYLLPDASPTARGVVTTTDQTFGGCKTTTKFSTTDYFANPTCDHFLAKQSVTNNNLHLGKNRDRTVSGTFNTLVGTQVSDGTTLSGANNTFLGYNAGAINTAGANNVAIGSTPFTSNLSGSNNIAIGVGTLGASTSNNNVAIGHNAGLLNTGNANVIIGRIAMNAAGAGASNVVIGEQAGTGLTSGDSNTIVGTQAGGGYTTGTFNTAIGFGAGGSSGGISNSIAIGHNATHGNTSNICVIGGSANASQQINTLYVGGGVTDVAPTNVNITTTGGSGTDIVGGSLTLRGGLPTGTGKSGDIIYQTSARDLVSSSVLATPIEVYRHRGSAITTSAATTTIIDSYVTSTNKTTTFNVRIVAKGTTTNSAFYNFVATFNNNGGTVTQVGVTTKLVEHETVAGWDMDFNINGTSVETRVVSTLMNISWVMSAEIFTV